MSSFAQLPASDFDMPRLAYIKVTSSNTNTRQREKIVLAARIIAAIDNPADVCVISARPYGQRAVLKFAAHTGASPIAGRFTPGNFTNYITPVSYTHLTLPTKRIV